MMFRTGMENSTENELFMISTTKREKSEIRDDDEGKKEGRSLAESYVLV